MSDINKVESLEELKSEFGKLGIEYTVESMKFLIKNKKSMAEVTRPDNPECTLFLIAAGTKEKTVDKAFEVIEEMRKKGVCLELLRKLCLKQAQDDDFFMGSLGAKMNSELMKESNQVTDEEALKEIMGQLVPMLKNLEQEKKHLETL